MIKYTLLSILLTIPCQAYTQFSVSKYVSSFFSKDEIEISTKEFSTITDLHIFNEKGNITINTWKHKTVMVEIIKSSKDLKKIEIEISDHEGILSLRTHFLEDQIPSNVDFNIIVPEHVAIKASTAQGNISIKQALQDIEAVCQHGNIEIYGGQKDLTAKTDAGNISIERTMIAQDTLLQAYTLKGDITFKTPQSTKSCIYAKTLQGKTTSELLITLFPKTTKINNQTWADQKKEIEGYITAKTDSKIQLKTNSGNIKILPLHV